MKNENEWKNVLEETSQKPLSAKCKIIIKNIQSDALEHAAEIAAETQRKIWTVDSPESEAIRWVNIEILKAARNLKEP
jgi:hypothetical protein